LSSLVLDATKPLLRQIEALQQTNHAREDVMNSLHCSLTSRVRDADEKILLLQQDNINHIQTIDQLSLCIKSLESALSASKSKESELTVSLEMSESVVDQREKAYQEALRQIQSLKSAHHQQIQSFKLHEDSLLHSLNETKLQLQLFQERVQPTNTHVLKQDDGASPQVFDLGMKRRLSDKNNSNAVGVSPQLSDFETKRKLGNGDNNGTGKNGNSYVLGYEQGQSSMAKKDNELLSLESYILVLEKTKGSLEEEVVRLTCLNESAIMELTVMKDLQHEMVDMRQHYATALELMGEKDEQVDELRQDLQDVKDLYKSQIDQLLHTIESLQQRLS